MKQNLLIATDAFLPRWDGISRFLSEIIPRLSKKYNITILAPDFPGKTEKIDAKVIRFPLVDIELGDIRLAHPKISELKAEIKKADIVWTQMQRNSKNPLLPTSIPLNGN